MNIADKDIIHLLQVSYDRISEGFQSDGLAGRLMIRDGLNDLDTILYLLKKASK